MTTRKPESAAADGDIRHRLSPIAEKGDGRSLRSARTRRLVVDVFLDLLGEGEAQPTAQQVADRSGVSMRSIFRLFEDVDALHSAAVAAQIDRVAHLFVPAPGEGPQAQRIHAMVDSRAQLFEAIAPVRRFALRLAPTSPPIRDHLDRANKLLRSQLAALFDAELSRLPPSRRSDVLDALDLVTSFEAWDRLRVVQEQSQRAARRIVAAAVAALIADQLLT